MVARVETATTLGLTPVKITVEIDTTFGTPAMVIIGLASKAVDEAKERITTALQNCGVRIRAKRTVVNLAPADLPKTGSAFELAIAIGLLQLYGEVTGDMRNTMCFGELALDGSVRGIKGALPLVLAARNKGYQHVIIPQANTAEVAVVSGITIHEVSHLSQIIACNAEINKLPVCPHQVLSLKMQNNSIETPLFDSIKGQKIAKRALQIAAAGGHNALLCGPPGSGKSLMAKAFQGILPPLSELEAIEVTTIHSIAGLTTESGLVCKRPYRSPHHTTSDVGLIGGGSALKPGEISLAHRGVLFLDEFPEFSRQSLEALRQPLETGTVTISRATGTVQYPARFTLIAAANPCPCGYAGTGQKPCTCSDQARQKYWSKLSGPILDRIDLHVHVKAVPVEELSAPAKNLDNSEHSKLIESIQKSREIQANRAKKYNLSHTTNSEIQSADIVEAVQLEPEALSLLQKAIKTHNLSARSYFKLMRVSRTIADLDQSEDIKPHHVTEALFYRSQTVEV